VRIDAHHHFWDPARRTYPWMGEELDAIRRPFGPDDLLPLVQQADIDRTILVQTVSSAGETSEFLAVAAAHDFIGGVVGWVDLLDPLCAGAIEDLRAAPGGLKLVGIRHQVQDEADPDWLLRHEVQRGIAAVGEAGLAYDLLVRIHQLPSAVETARRHRGVRFVLDHAAKPRIAAGDRDLEWEDAMQPFADLANVSCKLSGLVTEADWRQWTPAQLQPYVERVIGWFGTERCMFGSDWPVCLLAATYPQVVDSIRTVVGDNDDVFGAVTARVYGLT